MWIDPVIFVYVQFDYDTGKKFLQLLPYQIVYNYYAQAGDINTIKYLSSDNIIIYLKDLHQTYNIILVLQFLRIEPVILKLFLPYKLLA